MHHLARLRRHQVLLLGHLLETVRAQQLGFLQLQRAALVEQPPLLALERFQLVSFQTPGQGRNQRAVSSTSRTLAAPTALQQAPRPRGSAARTSRELSIFFEKKSTSSSGNARSRSEFFPDARPTTRRSMRLRPRSPSYLRMPAWSPWWWFPLSMISMARSLALREAAFSAVSKSPGTSGCW